MQRDIMSNIETMFVYSTSWPNGAIINKSDFDPKIHRTAKDEPKDEHKAEPKRGRPSKDK